MRRIRLFFKIRSFIPFVISFFCSREVAFRKKIAYLLLFIGYFLIPFDVIPDWLAGIGILDDLAVLMLILQRMIKTAPDTLKHKYGI
ncbi:YkvA family protein [Anoxybacteroides amylolyticum]|uniref:DUF1232 domain-containing protein n=1 Tax=Anoxybacteroides amylolyticum TaxID=294699 RepID=A0A160F4Y6_9BACL|nr:DUF1232 domain-containing protein [Anoxybacillus amylolyticus]ANB61032.1 hypothetical protein GFC30_987 [Anoxybacillus amylolyticus]